MFAQMRESVVESHQKSNIKVIGLRVIGISRWGEGHAMFWAKGTYRLFVNDWLARPTFRKKHVSHKICPESTTVLELHLSSRGNPDVAR